MFSDLLSAVNSLPFCVHLQTEGRTKEVLHSLGCLLWISIQVLSKCLFWKTLWRAYRWTATKNELCSCSKNTKETCVKQISLCKIELCLLCNYFSWGHFSQNWPIQWISKTLFFPFACFGAEHRVAQLQSLFDFFRLSDPHSSKVLRTYLGISKILIGTPLGPAQVSPGQRLSWAMLIINKQKENKFFCYSSLKMHWSLYFKQLDNLFKKNTINKTLCVIICLISTFQYIEW